MSGDGFANPIIGGGGALVYPSIHSPNFVHNVSGWTIKKDGSAEFDNLVVRGTFDGTDYILNNDGFFFYSGIPATGNLIASIASAAGVDGFGNPYQASDTVYDTATGRVTQLTAAKLLFFGGTGTFVLATRPGSLILSDALATNQQPELDLASPATQLAGPAFALIRLFGESQDSTLPAQIMAAAGGGTASPVTSAFLETQPAAGQTAIEAIPTAAANQVFATRISGDTNDRFSIDGNGNQQWGSGAAGPDCSLNRLSANLLRAVTADFAVTTLGRGLRVREGANCKQGTAVLVGGSVVVANTSVTANSRIFVGQAVPGGVVGAPFVSSVTAGTGFTIKSTSATDTSTVAYLIMEPG